ncbi:MAG TPA: hypothetical protein G4O18_03800 [Dehalococcoidia bacterium]|nr:hypothetical protein [Dehalococcoidia bacterium]
MAWQGMDPRLEGHMYSLTGGLNRWLLKHPFRGPVICFIIGGIFIGLSFIPNMERLAFVAVPLFLVGFFLLVYALIRRALGITFVEDEDVEDEPPSETPLEVDERARERALASWRRRARQDRHRRRNPEG